MIAEVCAIVGTGVTIIVFIVVATWKLATILKDLALEVRGHNKRLDFHKELLDELKVEIKTSQLNHVNQGK